MIELLPIQERMEDNPAFSGIPDEMDTLRMTIDYYKVIGYNPPWIGYFACRYGVLVGAAGYKGKPVNGRIEIAYGTFPSMRQKGIGGEICGALVRLAHTTDPELIITARTLPETNFSTRILAKNDFRMSGTVWDEEDGDVWEWIWEGQL